MLTSQWRQDGIACLWRYKPMPRMYSGWHFSADIAGCQSLLELLGALASEAEPAHRTLNLSDPEAAGADRIFGSHELQVRPATKLRIGFDPTTFASSIHDEEGRVDLALGPSGLKVLSRAITDLKRGDGDFSEAFGDYKSDPMCRTSFWRWPGAAL